MSLKWGRVLHNLCCSNFQCTFSCSRNLKKNTKRREATNAKLYVPEEGMQYSSNPLTIMWYEIQDSPIKSYLKTIFFILISLLWQPSARNLGFVAQKMFGFSRFLPRFWQSFYHSWQGKQDFPRFFKIVRRNPRSGKEFQDIQHLGKKNMMPKHWQTS